MHVKGPPIKHIPITQRIAAHHYSTENIKIDKIKTWIYKSIVTAKGTGNFSYSFQVYLYGFSITLGY